MYTIDVEALRAKWRLRINLYMHIFKMNIYYAILLFHRL